MNKYNRSQAHRLRTILRHDRELVHRFNTEQGTDYNIIQIKAILRNFIKATYEASARFRKAGICVIHESHKYKAPNKYYADKVIEIMRQEDKS